MQFKNLEKSFNRAIFLSINKKKIFLVFPLLIVCAFIIAISRALAFRANGWLTMSLIFLPILLTTVILLALGVVLNRIYYKEVKGIDFKYLDILKTSFNFIIETFYLSLPPIIVYLALWIVFGIFVLLKEIPKIGSFIGSVFSFAPFLIILSSLLLVVFNLFLLFFVSPAISIKEQKTIVMAKKLLPKLRKNIFSYLICFLIAVIPVGFIIGLLSLAAMLTKVSFIVYPSSISIALQWFCISLFFALLLTPFVIFFFNFSLESFNFFKEDKK